MNRREAYRSVLCPTCSAGPEFPCFSALGKVKTDFHARRRSAAWQQVVAIEKVERERLERLTLRRTPDAALFQELARRGYVHAQTPKGDDG